MLTKICSKCKRELPSTNEYFAKLTRNKDGLRSECKECKKKIDTEWDKNHPGHYKNETAYKLRQQRISKGTKICTKCHIEYPATRDFFEPWENGKYGVYSVCRTCNKGRNKEAAKRYYERNRENIKEKMKQYQKENKDTLSEKRKQYTKTDAGKQVIARSRAKRRNKNKSVEVNLSFEQWGKCKQSFNNKCAYCGEEKTLEREHFVPLSNGGEFTINNVLPACKTCNSSKNNKNFFDWYPNQPFYSLKREKKILKYLNYNPETKCQQLSIII